ncbi:MAG TPA: NAD(+) synthase [Firmicutes bacterium]|nr:NAD(+) synthase [Bacillota bacterium]
METLRKDICNWLEREVAAAGGKGCVFGLSGGIDSAVVAVLCKTVFPGHSLGLIMPCHSPLQDREDALALAEKFKITTCVIVLDAVYDRFIQALGGGGLPAADLGAANIKPRLRMNALYYYAARHHYRVIGTGNKSEISIGYFTKYGDGGVDLEPIGDLLKEDVYRLARHLDIPERILQKKPSAGLWEAQYDEDEMGFTYDELDRYLKGGPVDGAVAKKMGIMIQKSMHKRKMPPICTVKR